MAVFLVGVLIGILIGVVLGDRRDEAQTATTPEATSSPTVQAAATPETVATVVPVSAPTATIMAPQAASTGAQPEQVAPDFSLPDTEANDVLLSSYRGKKVVLVFWETTDFDSEKMIPELRRFAQGHSGNPDVELLTVHSGESRDRLKQLKEINGWEFRILVDESSDTMTQYEVSLWPTTFVLDRDGVIKFREQGQRTADDLNEQVLSIP